MAVFYFITLYSSVSSASFLQSVLLTEILRFLLESSVSAVSTDMAPGVHPDFMEKHGENQWSEMQQDLLSISLFFGCSVRERDAQRKIYRHYVQVFQGILS